MKDWFYDEFQHVGVDYSESENANAYDRQMDFRDYDAEVTALIEALDLEAPADLTAVDLGCGTGAFSIHAAPRFKKVYAVDVSRAMQRIAKDKATSIGIDNIEFVHGGMLGFAPSEPVDVVNSKWVLHHLPDYWKQVALLSVNRMLKPGGVLYLVDVVFQFDTNLEKTTEQLLEAVAQLHPTEFVDECKVHIREEFSTFDWILKGMIERAGFDLVNVDMADALAGTFVCKKVAEV